MKSSYHIKGLKGRSLAADSKQARSHKPGSSITDFLFTCFLIMVIIAVIRRNYGDIAGASKSAEQEIQVPRNVTSSTRAAYFQIAATIADRTKSTTPDPTLATEAEYLDGLANALNNAVSEKHSSILPASIRLAHYECVQILNKISTLESNKPDETLAAISALTAVLIHQSIEAEKDKQKSTSVIDDYIVDKADDYLTSTTAKPFEEWLNTTLDIPLLKASYRKARVKLRNATGALHMSAIACSKQETQFTSKFFEGFATSLNGTFKDDSLVIQNKTGLKLHNCSIFVKCHDFRIKKHTPHFHFLKTFPAEDYASFSYRIGDSHFQPSNSLDGTSSIDIEILSDEGIHYETVQITDAVRSSQISGLAKQARLQITRLPFKRGLLGNDDAGILIDLSGIARICPSKLTIRTQTNELYWEDPRLIFGKPLQLRNSSYNQMKDFSGMVALAFPYTESKLTLSFP